MHKFYKSIRNIKIDMTNFLNLFIKHRKKGIKMIKINKYWYEIDNQKDYKVAKNSIFIIILNFLLKFLSL